MPRPRSGRGGAVGAGEGPLARSPRRAPRNFVAALVAAFTLALAGGGCNSILGNSSHQLAAGGGGTGGGTAGSGGGAGKAGGGGGGSAGGGIAGGAGGSGAGGASNPGGPVTSLLCGDAGTCVLGGIVSGGQAPAPDAGTITVTDDGFEFGGASCTDGGATCVTGGITP